jgi:hypothetical protein
VAKAAFWQRPNALANRSRDQGPLMSEMAQTSVFEKDGARIEASDWFWQSLQTSFFWKTEELRASGNGENDILTNSRRQILMCTDNVT